MGWQDDAVVGGQGGGWQNDPVANSAPAPRPAPTAPIEVAARLAEAKKLADQNAPTKLEQWLAERFAGNDVGNIRGSAVGRVMQGMADPGAAVVQMGANAIGLGDSVNKRIADVEKQYQAERAAQGSTGFDPLRLAGNVAITLPAGGLARVPATFWGKVGQGAATGAGSSVLNPVTDGGEDFWAQKAKQAGIGVLGGAALGAAGSAVGRVISPKASTNADVKLLRDEGVDLTVGQSAGGWLNRLEEKAQSIPVLGDAITAARQRGNESFNRAALNRAMEPVGQKATETGSAGIETARKILGAKYDELLPKMAINVTDDAFVGKVAQLRSMAQSLPETEAKRFDAVLTREIEERLAPNGVLSAQNLKNAMAGVEREAKSFASSSDTYQRDLGNALKQLGAELRDHVRASNPQYADQLKKIDKGYANFKRVQRAGASVGAAGGESSPAQLYSAVKALDKSKDKARFAEDAALMQDLAGAGKRVMGSSVRNSGTADRLFLGGGATALASGMVNPAIPIATGAAAATYAIPQVQNFLVKLLAERPEYAPALANSLQSLVAPTAIVGGQMVGQ